MSGALRCAALVIDTEEIRTASGRPRQLAEAMRGSYARLEDLDGGAVVRLAGGLTRETEGHG